MDETLRRMGLDRTRARKGAVRPKVTGEDVRRMLADVATSGGVPFVDAASQAQQGNYGQAAISGLLDAPPVKMAGMALAPLIGMVKGSKAAPMDEALRIAQKNAAKPVSEGGLGLPKNNTPMNRAKAMGFEDKVLFHGTTNDFPAFVESRQNIYATDMPVIADIYAMSTGRHKALREITAGPNVIPLKARGNQLNVSDFKNNEGGWMRENLSEILGMPPERNLYKKLPEKGYSSAKVEMDDLGGRQFQYVFPDPKVLRSRFAAFDPARINENNLLASLAALGIGIPTLRGLLQEEEMQ